MRVGFVRKLARCFGALRQTISDPEPHGDVDDGSDTVGDYQVKERDRR